MRVRFSRRPGAVGDRPPQAARLDPGGEDVGQLAPDAVESR
ncbi:hypothetical protein [Streptomyces sp. NPDC048606]